MWVRQLVGRQAGTIVEMDYADAMNAKENGTVEIPTEREIGEAGHQTQAAGDEVQPEQLLAGYDIRPNLGGRGFDLVDPGGVPVNREDQPIENYIAARDRAIEHARAARGLPPRAERVDGDGKQVNATYGNRNRADLERMARERGLDTTKLRSKAEVVAALEESDREAPKRERERREEEDRRNQTDREEEEKRKTEATTKANARGGDERLPTDADRPVAQPHTGGARTAQPADATRNPPEERDPGAAKGEKADAGAPVATTGNTSAT